MRLKYIKNNFNMKFEIDLIENTSPSKNLGNFVKNEKNEMRKFQIIASNYFFLFLSCLDNDFEI